MSQKLDLERQCVELRDICWDCLDENFEDIMRIANNGPNFADEADEKLVQMVFQIVQGELNYRYWLKNDGTSR